MQKVKENMQSVRSETSNLDTACLFVHNQQYNAQEVDFVTFSEFSNLTKEGRD